VCAWQALADLPKWSLAGAAGTLEVPLQKQRIVGAAQSGNQISLHR